MKKKIYNTKTLYKKFLGFLIKKGNLISAKKILDNTFIKVSQKTGLSMEVALLKLFLMLNTFVEVKKVRIRRRSFLVPFSITLNRRSYLIAKWLMQSIKDERKSSMVEKLTSEIISVIAGNNSKSKKLKLFNISQAMANRSNTHYRW